MKSKRMKYCADGGLNMSNVKNTMYAAKAAEMDTRRGKLSKRKLNKIAEYGAKGQTYVGKPKRGMTTKKMQKALKKK